MTFAARRQANMTRLVVDDFTPFYQSAEPTCNLPVVWYLNNDIVIRGRIAHLCPRRMDLRPAVNLGACTSAHCMDTLYLMSYNEYNAHSLLLKLQSYPCPHPSHLLARPVAFVRYDITSWTSIDEWRWALYLLGAVTLRDQKGNDDLVSFWKTHCSTVNSIRNVVIPETSIFCSFVHVQTIGLD